MDARVSSEFPPRLPEPSPTRASFKKGKVMRKVYLVLWLLVAGAVYGQEVLEPIPATDPASVGVDCCGEPGARDSYCCRVVNSGLDLDNSGNAGGDVIEICASRFCRQGGCVIRNIAFSQSPGGGWDITFDVVCVDRRAQQPVRTIL